MIISRVWIVNGGAKVGQRGGVKAGQWREDAPTCKGARSGPFACRRRKIVPELTDGNFASVWIDYLGGGPFVRVGGGEFPGTRGLRQPITLAIHRQDVDMVGQPVEERAGQALRAEHRCPFLVSIR